MPFCLYNETVRPQEVKIIVNQQILMPRGQCTYI